MWCFHRYYWLLLVHLFIAGLALKSPCRIGDRCDRCHLIEIGSKCSKENSAQQLLLCDQETGRIDVEERAYLLCDEMKKQYIRKLCAQNEHFTTNGGGCVEEMKRRYRRQGVTGSGRVGDFCSFNTDCLNGMFCSSGTCTCLSNFVAIQGYCYLKKNPGESGCQYAEQCSAVWPDARCEKSRCECPHDVNGVAYIQSKTRDGIICILKSGEDGDPVPKCPLPEYDDDLLTMPVSQLRNPAMTDPDNEHIALGEHINPLQFCTSTSTDYTTFVANGGGACVYRDDQEDDTTTTNGVHIADLYDCIKAESMDMVKEVMHGIYDVHPKADGICCPNRAFTCIQPKREANTGSSSSSSSAGIRPRWWFNAVTGTCEQFMWDPWDDSEMQSPNNFKTREHCESYCRDTCKRGSPQYTSAISSGSGIMTMNDEERLSSCDTSGSSCNTNYECNRIGSMQLCCPTIASICSKSGARPIEQTTQRNTNYDDGYMMHKSYGEMYAVSTRYYYDVDEGRCVSFVYKGAMGNYNNFKTSSDCELFCAKLQCQYGAPLKIGATNQRCTSNADCPTTHQCQQEHNVCCPTPQAICSQPLRLGDCKQSVRRYWYNAVTRSCEVFDYTGCQGNNNNFETLLECQSTCENVIPEPQCPQGDAYKDSQGNYFVCSNSASGNSCPVNYECYFDGYVWGCCPTKAYTCTLSYNKGVTCGSGSSHRYYYNAQTKECDSFQYNGCDGNSNNFASRDECENYCGIGGCPNGGTPERNEFGQLMVCSSSATCPSTHECTSVNSGNSVVNRCCPTRAFICSLPPQQGNTCVTSSTKRYYFNLVTKQCTQFVFNGCSGNLNNFATNEQCNNFCLSSACLAGDIAYVNTNTNRPLQCDTSLHNSCPPNFVCTFDQLSASNVCCGATDMGVCPSGEKAYVNAVDMSVRECLINVDGSCPSNYLCRFNAQKNRYYCCASISGDLCPHGKALYREPSSKTPIRCTINSASNQCPSTYSCQSNVQGAFQGYCCSTNNVCPNKADFFIEESTQMPRSCTLGAFITCPNGYTCQSATHNNHFTNGYCCKGNSATVSDGCPPDEYVFMKDNKVVPCDPFDAHNTTCPSTYTCQWSSAKQRYQCCGSTPINVPKSKTLLALGCPTNQIAYREPSTNIVRVCTVAAANTCPIGYFCQFSINNNQFQCCGIDGGCPNEQVAFIGMNGEPQVCTMGRSSCPLGYSCQRSDNMDGKNICCTMGNHTTIKCSSTKEVLINGVCMKLSRPGEPCESSQQCQQGSSCDEGRCVCPRGQKALNGKCVRALGRAIMTCPIVGQIPYVEQGTTKVRFCVASSSKRSCPRGFTCQFSETAQRHLCCGQYGTSTSTNRRISSMVDNRRGSNGCAVGEALLFPSTGTPVQCSVHGPNLCPVGYRCVRSSFSVAGHQCCKINGAYSSNVFSRREFARNRSLRAPCPSHQVEVQRTVDGRIVKRCENSCPINQTAVRGICTDIDVNAHPSTSDDSVVQLYSS